MARFGGGHEAIAKAIAGAIEEYAPGQFQVDIEDGFPPVFSVSSNYGSFPFLFEQGYKITDNEKVARVIHATNTMLIGRHLLRLIRRHTPDLVIVTHPLLTVESKKVLERIRKKILLGIYFADAIHPHRFWYSEKNADVYFAPTKECYDFALKNGIDRKRMICQGWVLRKEYYQNNNDQTIIKKNLGFDENKKLVYLSGGGDGVGKIETITERLLANSFFVKHCQLAVICGTNHQLLVKLQKKQRKMIDVIASYGYINNVVDFKKAADVICSKAGPNDIFESIILGKPFFANYWFWVHEQDNFNWVKKQNIGFADRNPIKMAAKIIACLKNPELLWEKIENVKRIRGEHLGAPKVLAEKINEILE
jgi:1,2-diacylglycerol 3-beta-galactosyltransferase